MKIKNFEFKNNLILAPMANVTDVAFRSLCVDCGADAGVTELISAKAILYDNKRTLDMMHTADNEKIKIIQIFGNDPIVMAKACQSKMLKKFDIIDLNMGCPAPKILRNGEGGALSKDIDLAERIIRACVEATDKPITVKFRSGFDADHINAVEFAKMCEKAGASAITIHARTVDQGYSGKADWQIIKEVKNAVSIPVIGNGDVIDRDTYLKMMDYTGCDAVMVGRASMGNPKIFSEILGFKNAKPQIDFVLEHIEKLETFYSKRFVVKHMRKHILWYLKNVPNSNKLKAEIVLEPDLDKVVERLKQVF